MSGVVSGDVAGLWGAYLLSLPLPQETVDVSWAPCSRFPMFPLPHCFPLLSQSPVVPVPPTIHPTSSCLVGVEVGGASFSPRRHCCHRHCHSSVLLAHPTGRCSEAGGTVMCCGDVVALVHRLVSPPHCGSTHHPPHKQLLTRMGAGGVSW